MIRERAHGVDAAAARRISPKMARLQCALSYDTCARASRFWGLSGSILARRRIGRHPQSLRRAAKHLLDCRAAGGRLCGAGGNHSGRRRLLGVHAIMDGFHLEVAGETQPAALALPLGMLAELTHRCPLQCPYCSNPLHLLKAADELDTKTWASAFSQAAILACCKSTFRAASPRCGRTWRSWSKCSARVASIPT